MVKLTHVAKAMPSYAKYLSSPSVGKCVNNMIRAEKGGKVLVAFFEKAVSGDKWQQDIAFRRLLESAVKKSDALSSEQRAKFAKVEKQFKEKCQQDKGPQDKVQKVEQKAKPPVQEKSKGEAELLKTVDKIGKIAMKQGLDSKAFSQIKSAIISDLGRFKSMRQERENLLKGIETAKKDSVAFSQPDVNQDVAENYQRMLKELEFSYVQIADTARKVIVNAKEQVKEQHARVEKSGAFEDKKAKQLFQTFTKQFEELCDAELQHPTLKVSVYPD